MTKIKIATFNAENLFARYNFKANFAATNDGFSINDLAFDLHDNDAKKITAKVIKAMKADVVCLQEVENMEVLERFISRYLGGKGYKERMLIDSHDPRRIDVAIISKLPIINSRTYRHERKNSAWLFSRDCLQVTVEKEGKQLTIFNNHFKSMIRTREETKERRELQVKRVAEIITGLYSQNNYKDNFAVLGDFNDYPDGDTALTALLQHPGLVNAMERIPDADRWTHFWAGGNKYSQLDFILLGKELAQTNTNAPEIIRKGMPWRAEKYTGERFEDVGENDPKASDHCGVCMEIELN